MLKNSKKTVTFAGLINSKDETNKIREKWNHTEYTKPLWFQGATLSFSLSKEIEQLMNNAKDENEGCVSIELVAEFCVLQEELYQEALKKHKEEAN